jgi:hypothetical protein
MMRHAVAVLALLLFAAAPAHADRSRQVKYVGIHAIPKAVGGGTCFIEGPHVHSYAADKLQYRDHHGANFFVGDPVAYGYDGPKYAYKGAHPIQVDVVVEDDDEDVEYCYLDGPHYHAFAPPEDAEFQLEGGAYFYVGTPPKAFADARPAMVKINAVYKPLAYERPVITVAAPAGWIGARIDIIAPVVVVATPAAGVVVAPTIYVGRHKKWKKHKKWK